jgi:transcriptional regulator with XRE-family HTH domain
LQSLAYDLRKLRVENGNPTYRALARKAGYCASTLSEAARGNRKPTLDVLLAYVVALNGDQDAWRERWAALEVADNAASVPGPTDCAPVAGAAGGDSIVDSAEARPVEETAGTRFGWRTGASPTAYGSKQLSWFSPRIALMSALVIVLVVADALGLSWHSRTTPSVAAPGPGCPAVKKTARFTARTYGSGATIRQGPARVDQALSRVPAGCTIGLVGYCLGETIVDETAHTPDVRWFVVDGGGVVASAIVHGNPPAGLSPGRCPGDHPLPTDITLGMAGGPDRVTLTAAGRDVDVVGYAAYYVDNDGEKGWHQIGLTGPGSGDFAMRWNLPAGVEPVLAAAACLGGEGSTGVVDLRGTGGANPVNKAAAAKVACLYPIAK